MQAQGTRTPGLSVGPQFCCSAQGGEIRLAGVFSPEGDDREHGMGSRSPLNTVPPRPGEWC